MKIQGVKIPKVSKTVKIERKKEFKKYEREMETMLYQKKISPEAYVAAKNGDIPVFVALFS